jgi:hypothetical protein
LFVCVGEVFSMSRLRSSLPVGLGVVSLALLLLAVIPLAAQAFKPGKPSAQSSMALSKPGTSKLVNLKKIPPKNPEAWSISVPFFVVQKVAEVALSQPLVAWEGKRNIAPNAADPFLKHELAQLALGKTIRANPEEQGLVKSIPAAFTARDGYLHMNFGWRLHKAGLFSPKFADGTLDCDAYLAVEGGEPKVNVTHTKLHYNAQGFQKVLGKPFIALFETLAARAVERELEKSFEKSIDDAVRFLPYKQVLGITIKPDALVLSLKK